MTKHDYINETVQRAELRRELLNALDEPAMPIEFYFDAIDDNYNGGAW